jgi:hypothetical protein
MKNDQNSSNRKEQNFSFFKNLAFGTVLCEKEPILSQALF